MSRWSRRSDVPRGEQYDRRWDELRARGRSVHGEADFVCALLRAGGPAAGPDAGTVLDAGPATVLDAGCGTGRVAVELAARGVEVAGADLDPEMLDVARAAAPHLEWHLADLAGLRLRTADGRQRTFDVVVMAGNVMIFVASGTEDAVIASAARHLAPGGALVAGFQTGAGRLSPERYDEGAARAGLVLAQRWAGWDREPYAGGDYVVSVHRRPERLSRQRFEPAARSSAPRTRRS